LKLQVTFHFGKFLIWLQILQDKCLTWWISLSWTWMKCLKPFLHLLALSWLSIDFYGPQMTWTCTDDFWASSLWSSCFKMILDSHKLSRTTIGPSSHGNAWSLAQLTSPWCQLQLTEYNAMCHAMLMQC
jgi:hypothetical protein